MTNTVQQLAQTLLASKLAASMSEAQRMAKDMLGVEEKVNEDLKREQIYAVKGFNEGKNRPAEPLTLSNADTKKDVQLNYLPTTPRTSVPSQETSQQAPVQETVPSQEFAPVEQEQSFGVSIDSSPQEEQFSVSIAEPKDPAPAQNYARPEDRFASQFEGKTTADLLQEETSSQPQHSSQEKPEPAASVSQPSQFLSLKNPSTHTASQEPVSQPTFQSQEPRESFSQPQQSTPFVQQEEQLEEKTREIPPNPSPERKKSPEEEVDLSKIFSFGK